MEEARFHGTIGEEYDLFRLACPHLDELENNVGRIIAEYFKSRTKRKINVVEIGCGPGYTTAIILNSDERTNVIAVDNEPVMIRQAQEILRDYMNEGRVQLVQEDALAFLRTQRSDSVDVFASAFTLHNFLDTYRTQALREIYRMLKSGGLFVNGDKYALDDVQAHQRTLDWELGMIRTEYTEIDRPDLIKEWTTHYLEDNRPEIVMHQERSMALMHQIGFKDVKVVYRKQMEAIVVAEK